MTREHAKTLMKSLEEAKTEEELRHAIVRSLGALIDCHCKTADRVKMILRIAWTLAVFCVLYASGGSDLVLKFVKLLGAL